jgi:hypothetical protein
MKHIVIKKFGPIDSANVELSKTNVLVGPQSSGKSCLLKTVCFCTWIEKRMQLSQNRKQFLNKEFFLEELVRYHKMPGFLKKDTYIRYESDSMLFSYNNDKERFFFKWRDRWGYTAPKVSYIPAERNLVATIPNWWDVKLPDNNIRGFISEWDEARKGVVDLFMLNLGLQYHYNKSSNQDNVELPSGEKLELTDTSSGLQSLVPLCIQLEYLYNRRFVVGKKESYSQKAEKESLLHSICDEVNDHSKTSERNPYRCSIDNIPLTFNNKEDALRCREIYDAFVLQKSTELFLEEPEQNLFPPTQMALVNQLNSYVDTNKANRLFVATHSPYLVTAFLEQENLDLSLFVTIKNAEGRYVVKKLSKDEMKEAYDYGVDVFFNIELYR